MEFDNILLEKTDKIAIITLNRPPMNPLSISLLQDVNLAIENIKND